MFLFSYILSRIGSETYSGLIIIIFMLGDIFYVFGLFLFFLTLTKSFAYFKFIDVKEWIIKFTEKIKRTPIKSDYRSLQEYNMMVSFGLIMVFESLWFILGLLTSNWKIFGIVLLFNMLSKVIIDKLPFPVQKVVGSLLSIIRSILIIVLVINHFHLHYDLYSLI